MNVVGQGSHRLKKVQNHCHKLLIQDITLPSEDCVELAFRFPGKRLYSQKLKTSPEPPQKEILGAPLREGAKHFCFSHNRLHVWYEMNVRDFKYLHLENKWKINLRRYGDRRIEQMSIKLVTWENIFWSTNRLIDLKWNVIGHSYLECVFTFA